jgi:hypothetical protein
MGLRDKLFPKSNKKSKDEIITKAKRHIKLLSMRQKNYQKKAEISRKNAKIAMKRGEKNRAKMYLVNYKQYQAKVDRTNNLRLKIESKIGALEEGELIGETGELMGGMRDHLKDTAQKVSPEKIAKISGETEYYEEQIREAGEILGEDPLMDAEYDVDAELEKLEAEVTLEGSGEMPEAPGGDLEYISESTVDDVSEVDDKDKVKEEIKKLKEELK